jgi:hypothetical protein
MKNTTTFSKIKGFLIVLFVSTLFVVSCTNDSNETTLAETTVSPSLRVALSSMLSRFIPAAKLALSNNDDAVDDDVPQLCFDFVYPITLSYNTGEAVVVNSLDEIVELLQSETNEFFLNGIAFPFQVDYFSENLIITVVNENGFEDLNLSCGDDYYDDDDFDDGSCYEFQFPISLINADNQVFEVQDLNVLYDLFANGTTVQIVNFVYPVNLIYNNEIVVIQNLYQFAEIEDDCYGTSNPSPGNDDFDCTCTTEVNPVCVMTENGQVLVYTNACLANCDGYNDETFVQCD